MKQVKTNFESFIVIGVLIIAISLIGSSLPGLPLMLETQWDNVFAQAFKVARTNLQFSHFNRSNFLISCICKQV